jgi:DNA-binding MarR family transcriptional regulator
MTVPLESHVQTLRRALLDGDQATAAAEQDWLMGEAAAALLQQDTAAMTALRVHLADLAPLADRYGDGRPGDRWRAVWELLQACGETIRPLEQVRLADASRLSGLLLRHIGASEGITPTELGERTGKRLNHISNILRALMGQGLVHRIPQGREGHYYLSDMGRALLAQSQPVRAVAPASKAPAALPPHVREKRLQGRDTRRLPTDWKAA